MKDNQQFDLASCLYKNKNMKKKKLETISNHKFIDKNLWPINQ